MSLLLKVMATALTDDVATVPKMKSATLSDGDAGTTVYVWLGDDLESKSALYAVGQLSAFESLKVPQVRDPSKQKDAYRIVLAGLTTKVFHPLSTDDLGPYRYVEDADGIESLGRIHRDRNDKIIRLTGAEATVLAERFNI
ncbi:hypothetical protein [Octadecabacter antarcticus]|nr:hypothetical protein [Octadecabacter antarcticus]